jgi:hypothetical protein
MCCISIHKRGNYVCESTRIQWFNMIKNDETNFSDVYWYWAQRGHLDDARTYLRILSDCVREDTFTEHQQSVLASILTEIGNGADPNEVLRLKLRGRPPGQDFERNVEIFEACEALIELKTTSKRKVFETVARNLSPRRGISKISMHTVKGIYERFLRARNTSSES